MRLEMAVCVLTSKLQLSVQMTLNKRSWCLLMLLWSFVLSRLVNKPQYESLWSGNA